MTTAIEKIKAILDGYEKGLKEDSFPMGRVDREAMRAAIEEIRTEELMRSAYLDLPAGETYKVYAKNEGSKFPVIEFEARGDLVELRKLDARGQIRSAVVLERTKAQAMWTTVRKGYKARP